MRRILFSLGLASLLALPALAEEAAKQPKPVPPRPTPLERLAADPNDVKGFLALRKERLAPVSELMDKDKLDEAEKLLKEVKDLFETLKPDEKEAITTWEESKELIASYQEDIDVARVTLAALEKRLDSDADDLAAVVKYGKKIVSEFYEIVQDEPAKASAMIKGAKERMARVKEEAEDAAVKRKVATTIKTLDALAKRAEGYQKNLDFPGKPAAPLHDELEAWVNGEPLTDESLRGKVVILDFWAVWCGPCIATFPHLREWNEKYEGKGLVIIGLTNYYNYRWDDLEEKAVAVKKKEETVPAEEEHAMLRKFAQQHSLHHRFAVQKKEGTLDDYYNVSGIPHVVVIDQLGKVRLIRVGSGEKNAKMIDALLAELLGEKTAAAPGAK